MLFQKKRHSAQADEELMALIASGNTAAFDALYSRYAQRIHFYFQKMLWRDQALAEDFLHDLFLKIIERPELYRPPLKFSTWIFSIAHNMCKNEYRRRHVRENAVLIPEPDFSLPADTIADDAAFAGSLADELEKLSEEHRSAFLLRHHENLSLEEIAVVLGCPVGTVKSRLYYATKRLAEKLKEFNPNSIGMLL